MKRRGRPRNRHPKKALLTIAVAICCWLFQPGASAADGGFYRIPLASEPTTLDPAYITGIYAVNVAMNLFDGLVEFDRDLNVVPAIARVWKISRDHRTYTFFLRRGVRFHNGREVTASDFVYSISRILAPETKSPVASLFMNIEGAREFNARLTQRVSGLQAPDPYTLKIVLSQPFAPFLSILAMANAKVVPREVVGPEFGNRPVGTGPFRFRHWEKGKYLVLAANKEYFGGQPRLDGLYFRIYKNIEWERIFADFEKGELEQSIIPSSRYDEITSSPYYRQRYNLVSKPTLSLVYVGMNVRMFPFTDRRVRRAFAHAVNTEAIVREITKRGSVVARGILPPGIAGYDPHFLGNRYDPELARKLLAQAGHPQGQGIPPIEIWTVSKAESVQRELAEYERYLAAVGITLVPKTAKNWREFITFINERRAPMYYAAWYADYPDPDNFLYVLCHSSSPTNRMGYSNPEVDALLEEARRETDYMTRVKLYRRAQALVMEDAPLICQHVNSFNYLFQPWVRGVKVSYLGAAYIPFREVWLEGGPK